MLPKDTNAYQGCLRHCFESLTIRVNKQWPEYFDGLAVTFDSTESKGWAAIIAEEYDLAQKRDNRLCGYGFTKDDQAPCGYPLQAADLVVGRVRLRTKEELENGKFTREKWDKLIFKGADYRTGSRMR
jgi:hypothetical protein